VTDVDFSGSGGKELIDQGVYPCTVTGMEMKQSEKTGRDYYAFEFTVASGDWEGYKLWHNNTIGAKDRNYYLKCTLEGITGQEIPLDTVSINERDYLGRGCQVQVIHDQYNGKLKAAVATIHPAGDEVFDSPKHVDKDYTAEDPHPVDNAPW
jgi:hypothetical protein